MTRRGLESAFRFGDELPSFRSLEEARAVLFAARDEHLEMLADLASKTNDFAMDYSPDSLKSLESWYFKVFADSGDEMSDVDRSTFEHCMAMYFGAVIVKSIGDADWIVEPYVFTPTKFEIGVKRGLLKQMLTRACRDLIKRPGNKSRTSLFGDYRRYFT